MEKKSYTVAIDLGSSSVVVAVGSKREDGSLGIEAIVSKPVEGVNAGRIDNIEQAGNAIREAVAEAEASLGVRITEAYAGISGEFVRCARHIDHVFTYDPQNGVNQADVDALFDRMRNVQAPDDETIMERIPQHYLVDDAEEVRNPVGSFCKRLSSTFNFILCDKIPLQRLDMALRRLGIRALGVFPNALAAPEAVLSADEKEEGVAVVDIGGGVTDVTVYYRGVPRYVATIPMGAKAINRDIRSQSIPEKHVEGLKCKYGSAVADLAPDDKMIRVSGRTAREAKDILLRNLATVIEARATDIVEFVQQEIRDSGYAERLAYGIVLTGGSAQLKDIEELFRRVTGMDVRIASAETGLGEESRELVANPAYTTVVGLLLKGAGAGPCNVIEEKPGFTPRQTAAATPPIPSPQTKPQGQSYIPPRPATEATRPYTPPRSATEPARPQSKSPEAMHSDPTAESEEGVDPTASTQESGKRERNWRNIFKKTLDKINEGFNAADDEEI